MKIVKRMRTNKLTLDFVSAGTWFGDGGAAMGIMPKALWQKLLEVDQFNRLEFALNTLLIRDGQNNILVDTGIGNKLSAKKQQIFHTSDFTLLDNLNKLNIDRTEINYVILSHLHFDHAGGIVSIIDGKPQLSFPNAIHLIQRKEWEMAKNPDDLNKAAYDFEQNLKLLEISGNFQLIDGDYDLTDEISLQFAGGHSEGLQVVQIKSDDLLAYYAADLFPLEAHRHLAVTAAYDVCRRDTFASKKRILTELAENKGFLLINHDMKRKVLEIK